MSQVNSIFPNSRFYLGARIGVRAMVFLLGVTCLSPFASAKPKVNAQRQRDEPRWNSQVFMKGEEKAINKATPILERDYRPGHVYGNMYRRHHYRGTVVPSHRDRTDMGDAVLGYPEDRYR